MQRGKETKEKRLRGDGEVIVGIKSAGPRVASCPIRKIPDLSDIYGNRIRSGTLVCLCPWIGVLLKVHIFTAEVDRVVFAKESSA